MGVFRPVIEALVLPVLDPRHDLPLGRGIALQLVGDGTTNTVIALARPSKRVRAVTFPDDGGLSELYRSVLCFEHAGRHDIEATAGFAAIRAYLTSIYETRFIQSFKSHVASAVFDETRVFGKSGCGAWIHGWRLGWDWHRRASLS